MQFKRTGDAAGVWHHVTNRGIARRTVFEHERDVRFFLSRVAYAVRAGWIEVHAYSIMTTHFHLLVRSREVGLSHAMARVLNDYVRWFNRGRKRDGALFRGRYQSRVVDSIEYRRAVVRYIDANAVQARMAPTPALYPHCSAARYARTQGPRWLARAWVEAEVRRSQALASYDPRAYPTTFDGEVAAGLVRVIEQRVARPSCTHDPLAELIEAAPQRVLEWMRRKAALADGTEIDLPVCDAVEVLELLRREQLRRPTWLLPLSRVCSSGWELLEVGLARDLCASSWSEIGRLVGSSPQSATRAYQLHARALLESEDYASTATGVASAAVRASFGAHRSTYPD